MIRKLLERDLDSMLEVINDAAQAYKGIIPNDRWKKPYMSAEELGDEIDSGVNFFGLEKEGRIIGVMGIQEVKNITLIRHAYIATEYQGKGLGGKLLQYLINLAKAPEILVGTWQSVSWAIQFYEKHGFALVLCHEKDMLLRKYWNIPERQIDTSVVLRLNKTINEVRS